MANTQTTVPLFVANQVLTASQQNLSAGTGVPVFATTVTRDAAFGGSNKALAEGQLAYIEASNIVQYYDGAAWATVGPTASKIAQVVSTTKTDTFTTTSATYVDVTGLSLSITPTLNTSKIYLVATMAGAGQTVNTQGFGQFVRNTTAIGVGDAAGSRIQATFPIAILANTFTAFGLNASFLDSPATTSATTYKIQIRNETGSGTVYINRSESDANSASGGRYISTITALEILA
jgi:hypothetical protein